MSTRKLFLRFPRSETEKPVIYHLVKDFGLEINIFRARVTADEEGYLVLDVSGDPDAIARGIAFVEGQGVTVDPVNKGVCWDPERCTHCGNCITHCPTHALSIPDRGTMRVTFTEELCIECLACLKNCPYNACITAF